MELFEKIEGIFLLVVNYCVLIVELIGVAILVWAVVRAILGLIRKQERVRLDLAEGIALALEFKLGSELLRTLVVREWEELLILGAVILLRAALTLLIQWEIKIEKKNEELAAQKKEEEKSFSPSQKDE
ncbi:MAG: DUF1622 domain-containing protein [Clostridia bacterium]|nr:DUF1622 domain-containing protein [Clostridia bacterium]